MRQEPERPVIDMVCHVQRQIPRGVKVLDEGQFLANPRGAHRAQRLVIVVDDVERLTALFNRGEQCHRQRATLLKRKD